MRKPQPGEYGTIMVNEKLTGGWCPQGEVRWHGFVKWGGPR